ncbi:NUMOD1 domain-containing DNA-binding protein [Aestuariibaculum sp. M13]|uniref:NUMOD1 domain-containing DNA-binding protein n=1 Tax=Aestuariibaculum sp. M13 TaxID=2967132 RepID=UPI002159FBAE|nr:NUMOD1 domain-containing DNA-binding protein [Aestuariibaculum sp. M13]
MRKKKVVLYSLAGKPLAEFQSVAEASKKTGVSKTCIARCCRGERPHSGGFIWKYK